MDELIYKRQALDAINRCRDDYDLARQEQIDDCENAVKELPTVTERTGHWIIRHDSMGATYGECSKCGMKQYAGRMNYCPNCGAHMEGGEDV